MQIQFKQTEIIAALKGYIVSQGINLNGKSVDISFTAGRKEGGLIADVTIEDAASTAVPPTPIARAVVQEAPIREAESVASNEAEEPKTTSLFG